ncbi:hypothetical protein GZ051_26840 [Klebsiella oxytoca]|uniref:hypothetical protein n=1 Tax=Klebsiella oxytoca TaxID=571 RepID=UPI00190EDF95|nr:hypothetical protein [Klebsiella oxytoca]MBK0678821.1 hypothetical protein [Klebsiella oxytoca]
MAKKGIEKIVQEALLKGYTVNRSGDRFEISKPGKKLISLVILPDGTAYRGDVELTITKTIWTQKQMKVVLGFLSQKSNFL